MKAQGTALAVLALLCGVALVLGAVPLDVTWTPAGLASGLDDTTRTILVLRLYRVIACVLVGAGLAVSGATLQRLLRNPLADPFILGVSSGGGVAVAAASLAGWFTGSVAGVSLRILVAFLGCMATFALLLTLKRRLKSLDDDYALPVIGLLLNAFFGALLLLLVSLSSNQQVADMHRWLIGSFQSVGGVEVFLCALLVTGPLFALVRNAPAIDALVFGREVAQSVGFPAEQVTRMAVVCVAMLMASVVSLVGAIGFVGLIVPHIVRAAARLSPAAEFRMNMTLGACLVLGADVLARTIARPAELPVGVFTALVGAPTLAFLVLRLHGRTADSSVARGDAP